MKKLIRWLMLLFTFSLMFLTVYVTNAKRAIPSQPKNIEDQYVIYSAPLDKMGYIEAKDAITGRLIWETQLYKINYDKLLEKDIQDVYIVRLEKDGDLLTAVDERGNVYRININDMLQRKGYKFSSVLNRFIQRIKDFIENILRNRI